MTVNDYRVRFGWSRERMADEAQIDITTLRRALNGKPIYQINAEKIAQAINRELARRNEPQIKYTDLEIVFAD